VVNRVGRLSRLVPEEDLPPPVDVGGGDPSAAAKAFAGWDTTIHWLSRQTAH
jgi:hypothetical protein